MHKMANDSFLYFLVRFSFIDFISARNFVIIMIIDNNYRLSVKKYIEIVKSKALLR